jgi:hypothetical protein
MELADVTDSKSVGSNTVRVRPPPSAPKSVTPLNEWGYTFCVLGGANSHGAGKARMPYKMNAQSFARCETNKAFINVQRMHDSGRTESLHDAATQTTAKARMPYKMNAQRLCTDAKPTERS